ncbi:MAG: AAA family ATPase [Eggerthellaceae bacterium]|nr:AAA family ATPase [Eggerthellaceae bacterium]
MAVLGKTLSDLMMSPTVHFHHLPNGEPHVHEKVSAKSHPGRRVIAICGKGGVGKTAFSAMAAHALMHREDTGRLLVIDADPAFGLAFALGMPTEPNIATVREALLSAARSGDIEAEQDMARELDYMVFESLVETDGFAFLAMGRSRDLGCYCAVNDLLRDAVELLVGEFDTVLIDGEAGLEQINRQVVASVDDLIVVSDGSLRGLKTVTSVVELAHEHELVPQDRIHLVLNRQDGEVDAAALQGEGVPELLGAIPADAELAAYDRAGEPLTKLPHENAAAHAVWHVIDHLMFKSAF